MSDNIIRIKSAAFSLYEELLMERDELLKEAFQCERAYIREFGDLILQVFQMKLECIRKKKTIEYCQAFVNKGEAIDSDAMQEYLKKEMKEYEKRLEEMLKEHEESKGKGQVTDAELLKIKRIYHHLVKKIHPDINPLTNKDSKLKGLWLRMIAAYNCNDLKEMEETEFAVNSYLEQLDLGVMDIEIPDIEEKIKDLEDEIREIKSKNPYLYKFLLADEKSVREKKEELAAELKEYEEYSSELDKVIAGFAEKGVKFTWRMN